MMRDKKKTERFLRNAPGAAVPSRLLERLEANIVLTAVERDQPAPNIFTKIVMGRIPKLAAAAVIVIAVGFLVIHTRPRPQTRTDGASQAAKKTPGEMLTVLSLNIAYRQGGMDAVEKQYEKAFKILGPRLTSISVQDLLAECNSNWKGQYYEKD